jgi:hypothetical protein
VLANFGALLSRLPFTICKLRFWSVLRYVFHLRAEGRLLAKKKPTWPNTLKYSTTSAYSLTDPPARPGYPLFSRPTPTLLLQPGPFELKRLFS